MTNEQETNSVPELVHNNESRFALILQEHPDWYIANCSPSWKLHLGKCTHQAPTNGILWTSSEKVCGPDRLSVEDWVMKNRGKKLSDCGFCLRARA